MHICYAAIDYHHNHQGGGIASYVHTLSRALCAQGHEVTVISKGAPAGIRVIDETRVVQTHFGNLHWYLYKAGAPSALVVPVREVEWSIAIRRAIDHVMKNRAIDVVEACETGILLLNWRTRPAVVIRLHGEPYVFQKHTEGRTSWGNRIRHKLELNALRRAAAATSPSHYQATEVAKDLGHDSKPITVIPNPIGPELLAMALTHQPTSSREDTPIVLCTGRLELRKGTMTLLHAVPEVTRRCPDARIRIAGGRHVSISDHKLNEVLNTRGVRDVVTLLGHVPWNQVYQLYQSASLYVMPSHYETFGIGAIEAMAFGLPVVATTAGGLPEVVLDEVTGLLVPPGDPQALAEAIVRLLRDPGLRVRLGRAGRERVVGHYTTDQVVPRTLSLYESVAAY